MAIAYDSSSQGSALSGSGLSWNWAHTITGANPVLIVAINVAVGPGVASVSWGSQVMTALIGGAQLGLWYLGNPHTGTDNINVVQTGGGTPSFGFATSYTGANLTQPDSSNVGFISSGQVLTVATTVISSNCWTVGFAEYDTNGGSPISAWTSNKTDRQSQTFVNGTFKSIAVLSDSNATVSPGSNGFTWTAVTSNSGPQFNSYGLVVSLFPVQPPASSSNFLLASL